jgi:esterase/lipase superfamily enzyme
MLSDENEPKLAQFISDLSDKCPNTQIMIIAHSLCARIVGSSFN